MSNENDFNYTSHLRIERFSEWSDHGRLIFEIVISYNKQDTNKKQYSKCTQSKCNDEDKDKFRRVIIGNLR